MTNYFRSQYALPSKRNLIQTSQRLRQNIKTVSVNPWTIRPEFWYTRYVFAVWQRKRWPRAYFSFWWSVYDIGSQSFGLGMEPLNYHPKSYQIYTLNVYLHGIASACLYALLPNKNEKTYSRLPAALETFAPDWKPDKVLLDFEIASTNASQKHHPASILSVCYFHLTQNFVRKTGELGLKKLVSENHEVALALKIIPALALKKMRKSKNLLNWLSRI